MFCFSLKALTKWSPRGHGHPPPAAGAEAALRRLPRSGKDDGTEPALEPDISGGLSVLPPRRCSRPGALPHWSDHAPAIRPGDTATSDLSSSQPAGQPQPTLMVFSNGDRGHAPIGYRVLHKTRACSARSPRAVSVCSARPSPAQSTRWSWPVRSVLVPSQWFFQFSTLTSPQRSRTLPRLRHQRRMSHRHGAEPPVPRRARAEAASQPFAGVSSPLGCSRDLITWINR